MSPTINVKTGLSPTILFNSKMEFSSFDKIRIALGLYLTICFTSAVPIEPVPPVTRIFLPLNSLQ